LTWYWERSQARDYLCQRGDEPPLGLMQIHFLFFPGYSWLRNAFRLLLLTWESPWNFFRRWNKCRGSQVSFTFLKQK
jgi:hypothetical protein